MDKPNDAELTIPAHLRRLADEVESGRKITAGVVITTDETDEMQVYSYGLQPGWGQRLVMDFVVSYHETHGLGKAKSKEVPSILVPGNRRVQ